MYNTYFYWIRKKKNEKEIKDGLTDGYFDRKTTRKMGGIQSVDNQRNSFAAITKNKADYYWKCSVKKCLCTLCIYNFEKENGTNNHWLTGIHFSPQWLNPQNTYFFKQNTATNIYYIFSSFNKTVIGNIQKLIKLLKWYLYVYRL